jgi:hypothetical protein
MQNTQLTVYIIKKEKSFFWPWFLYENVTGYSSMMDHQPHLSFHVLLAVLSSYFLLQTELIHHLDPYNHELFHRTLYCDPIND